MYACTHTHTHNVSSIDRIAHTTHSNVECYMIACINVWYVCEWVCRIQQFMSLHFMRMKDFSDLMASHECTQITYSFESSTMRYYQLLNKNCLVVSHYFAWMHVLCIKNAKTDLMAPILLYGVWISLYVSGQQDR